VGGAEVVGITGQLCGIDLTNLPSWEAGRWTWSPGLSHEDLARPSAIVLALPTGVERLFGRAATNVSRRISIRTIAALLLSEYINK